jgi:hypothetical protein
LYLFITQTCKTSISENVYKYWNKRLPLIKIYYAVEELEIIKHSIEDIEEACNKLIKEKQPITNIRNFINISYHFKFMILFNTSFSIITPQLLERHCLFPK